jgi:hypothetical protein
MRQPVVLRRAKSAGSSRFKAIRAINVSLFAVRASEIPAFSSGTFQPQVLERFDHAVRVLGA